MSHNTIVALATITLVTSLLSLFETYITKSEIPHLSLITSYLNIFVLIVFAIILIKAIIKKTMPAKSLSDINKLSLELNQQKFALDQHSIVAITDIKGVITYVNDKFIQISEYSGDELIGQNHRILNSEYHHSDFFRNMYRVISSGKVWRGEIKNQSKSGKLYWVDTTIVPFKNDKGKISSYISIRTDITHKKEILSDLLTAKETAESAALAKSDFLANMSHEIRTPMNGVLVMLELLQKADLPAKQKKQLGLARNSANLLLTIINDILDFSKIDARKLEIESIDFNLRKLIDDLVASMALKAEEKNIEFIVDSSQISISHVKGDPVRTQQVLTNLISNSLKFTDKGEIKIKAAVHDCGKYGLTFSCSVTDTGIGIPKDKQSNLFDAFTQADASTTREYGGTGLGLSISKRLCKLMGGSISLDSHIGTGSRFNFSIEVQKSAQEAKVLPNHDIKDLCILIVDSNESSRLSIQTQLSLWGASTLIAGSADEAFSKIDTSNLPSGTPVNLVLTDLNLPDMTGIAFMEKIHLIHANKISLALMTQIQYQLNTALISDLGFKFQIPKPVTTEDLLNLLSSYVTHSAQDTPPQENPCRVIQLNEDSTNLAKNILLVEDNYINQEVAKSLLDELNCNIHIANNGVEALDILKAKPSKFDVILMDCQMPELDGYETTKAIRRSEAGSIVKDIKIIAMTANAMKGDKEKCLKAGMNDYISKPINPGLLKEKLSL